MTGPCIGLDQSTVIQTGQVCHCFDRYEDTFSYDADKLETIRIDLKTAKITKLGMNSITFPISNKTNPLF